MNSFIILLVISMLFLDVFFSVSNKAIVVVFLAGRVEAGGGLGDSRRVSPTPVRRCPSRSLRLRRLLARLQLQRQAMEEGRQQLGRMTSVKVQVHGVTKDGLS